MKYLKPLKLYRELLKSNEVNRGRLLGLDVGERYVGLSVSDPTYKIAKPFRVLVRKKTNIDLMSTDFQNLISLLSLKGLVFGCPLIRHQSSRDTHQVKVFVDDLNKTGKFEDLKYTFWDECFSSKLTEINMKPLGIDPVVLKTIMDKFAAVGILQHYLDYASRHRGVNGESEDLYDEID